MNMEDTQSSMVAPDAPAPPPAERPGWRPDRRWVVRTAAVFGPFVLLGLLVAATFVVPVEGLGRLTPGEAMIDSGPVALRPGSARGTENRVVVDGATIFEPDGEILFTTVSIDDQVTIYEWLESEWSDDIELRTREEVFGTRTTGENRERNLELMQTSKDTAVLVALDHLGIDVADATGVGFNGVLVDGPADGRLVVGDVIIAIDDEPVTDFASLRALLDERAPGDTSEITLEDNATGEVRTETLVFGTHPEGVPGGFIGVENVVERIEQAPLPFDVDIDSGSIGGPSAGLAFTLTILDLLTPGELTGGAKVAVTGTIGFDGSVGNVGGLTQKAAAARAAGADVFIVPVDSVEEAEAGAGGMRVVGVADLDEALAALASLGGSTDDLALPDFVTAGDA